MLTLYAVILNVVKNLSESADILNTHYVILNEVKNLSESTDVRLLCYPVDASLSLSRTAKAGHSIITRDRRKKETTRDIREVAINHYASHPLCLFYLVVFFRLLPPHIPAKTSPIKNYMNI